MSIQRFAMGFLHERAMDRGRVLGEGEETIVKRVNRLVKDATKVIVRLGGKAGRLGESVVGTGLLEGVLQGLVSMGKMGVPVVIVVDRVVGELFDERLYRERYWQRIRIVISPSLEDWEGVGLLERNGRNMVILDFHGVNDGMPYLEIEGVREEGENDRGWVARVGSLFRVGFRSFAQRGGERRYADFVEELFALPEGAIDGWRAQPRILLADEDYARFTGLAERVGLDEDALFMVCFFQSVVPAKCYERWDEVLQLVCEYFAMHFPGRKIDFLLCCGPDEALPERVRRAELEEWLQGFVGVAENARMLVREVQSLRDLAILISGAVVVLANDTGPGHIAGALGIATITPYLPGTIYSKKVWSSTRWHRGVTMEPSPFTFEEVRNAVLWGRTEVINCVAPDELYKEVLRSLPGEFQVRRVGESKIQELFQGPLCYDEEVEEISISGDLSVEKEKGRNK